MNQDGADAGDLRSLQRSQYGIAQQAWTNSISLKCLIDGKAAENHDWNRVWHIAFDASRRTPVGYGAHGQRVVTDDPVFLANHIGPGSPTFFVGKSAAAEPIVQGRFTASELRQIMAGAELLRWANRLVRLQTYLSQGALALSRRPKRALLDGGLSSMAVKRLKSSAGRAK